MNVKRPLARRMGAVLFGVVVVLVLIGLGERFTVTAQGQDATITPAPVTQVISHTVRAGETLTRLANEYGTTVEALVDVNGIADPDLILVGQVLTVSVPAGWTPVPAEGPPAGPLAFTWSLVDWQPDDPDYAAVVAVAPQGGQAPYTFYHDGLAQEGDSFQVSWRRCRPKPGSIAVADAGGQYVKEEYWLVAPYCPVGVEILEPEEGADLEHADYHFNVFWRPTVDPAPSMAGMEVEVWEGGDWHPWKRYEGFTGNPFFVPDTFPGDLGGRVRMWGIYEGRFEGPKTPWRTFEFRVTY